MIVVNFFAGPGAGKSTTSADLFQHLKRKGVRAELVGEAAKDFIYMGASRQLENQVLLFASQYARLKNLERSRCDVAISDSPLMQTIVYAEQFEVPYLVELATLAKKCNQEFMNIDIFLRRGDHPYQNFGRAQTKDEAKDVDTDIFNRFKYRFHRTFRSDEVSAIRHYVESCIHEYPSIDPSFPGSPVQQTT